MSARPSAAPISHSDPPRRSDPDLAWSDDDKTSDPGRASPVEAVYVSAEPAEPSARREGTRTAPATILARVEAHWAPPPLPAWLEVRAIDHDTLSPDLVVAQEPNSVAAQQFRSLRYRLEQEPNLQLVAVTSARPNEGKSVTAANLALALAEGGRVRVLLIDAALRAPSQSTLFGLGESEGLTSVLSRWTQDANTHVTVHRYGDTLYTLAAGPRVGTPHSLLASETAAHLLGALRRIFRYIIVDASPVFGPAETLAWHGMVDRYIVVARRGTTRTEDLGKAADRLNRDKVLGVSFIGARERTLNG